LRNFNRLWAGQSVSLFGSAVTRLAIPTTAIFALHATPFQIGALSAATYIAFPVLGMFAGVLVDRWPRRRVLVTSDVVRAVLLASIPIAVALHALTLVQLFVVAIITSVATVFFDVAYQAFLPDIVTADRLAAANSRLEISNSVAQITGNAIAGALISAIGAALTVAINALSFVFSAVALLLIRLPRRQVRVVVEREDFVEQLRDGGRSVFGNPPLLRIVATTATSNLGSSMLGAVYLIFAYRTLHLSPAIVGAVFAVGNAGFVGALLAPRLVTRFGLPATLTCSMAVAGVVQFLVPLAVVGPALPCLIAYQVLESASVPIYNIAQVSWRQSTVPLAMQGRMNATVRTIAWGTIPLGALLGGALATAIGVVPTLVVAAVVQMSAVGWLLNAHVGSLGEAVPKS